MDRYNRSIPLVILCLLLCFALLLFSGAAQGDEDDSTVKAQPGNVDKDGQVSGEEAKLPANITVEGDEDELIRIHSMSLTPEGGWKFRAFTEDEKKPGALDITGSGKDYVDIEDGNPTPQSPTASIHGGKDHLTASAAFPEDQVDAGDYPLRMEGNLTGGEAGDGGGEPEERHWAAKSFLNPVCGEATIDEWKKKAYVVAGIDADEWDPENDTWEEIKPISSNVYNFYYQRYENNDDLAWYGLADKAGESLTVNLEALADDDSALSQFIDAMGAADQREESVEFLLKTQKKIFDNMAWHAVAYEQCGITEINRFHNAGKISETLHGGWKEADNGMAQKSGLEMLTHEQGFVSQNSQQHQQY